MMKKVIYLCTSKSRNFVSPIQPKTLNERKGATGIRELAVNVGRQYFDPRLN
jgi:hypothetical protein